ncbi:MAG: hypothetical protein LC792_11315, partial [Actinobacteria bacterium]|nr:hypothetical protein [Actinomycetota bacterium]
CQARVIEVAARREDAGQSESSSSLSGFCKTLYSGSIPLAASESFPWSGALFALSGSGRD